MILRKEGIDLGRVTAELNRSLDKLRTGNARAPSLSPDIVTWLREAWMIASLEGGHSTIRSGHMLAALLPTNRYPATHAKAARRWQAFPARTCVRTFRTSPPGARKTSRSRRVRHPCRWSRRGDAPRGGGPLDQFCTDLTGAGAGRKIDPILGRDSEIRQMVDILTRRRQNNPILTGEPGVGKTAVVEGLALRIAASDVPRCPEGCAVDVARYGPPCRPEPA